MIDCHVPYRTHITISSTKAKNMPLIKTHIPALTSLLALMYRIIANNAHGYIKHAEVMSNDTRQNSALPPVKSPLTMMVAYNNMVLTAIVKRPLWREANPVRGSFLITYGANMIESPNMVGIVAIKNQL